MKTLVSGLLVTQVLCMLVAPLPASAALIFDLSGVRLSSIAYEYSIQRDSLILSLHNSTEGTFSSLFLKGTSSSSNIREPGLVLAGMWVMPEGHAAGLSAEGEPLADRLTFIFVGGILIGLSGLIKAHIRNQPSEQYAGEGIKTAVSYDLS